jgi:hypothetical protein
MVVVVVVMVFRGVSLLAFIYQGQDSPCPLLEGKGSNSMPQ